MVTAIHTIKLVGLGVTLIFQICLVPLRKMIEQNLIIFRAETQWNLSLSLETLIHWEYIFANFRFRDEELVNILQSFESGKTPKKLQR